jgi:hypothetical protein
MLAVDAGELFLPVDQEQEPASFEPGFVFGTRRAGPDSLQNRP